MRSKLALCGGRKTIDYDLKRYNPIGSEEKAAVMEVMDSGILSDFLGVWDEDKFYGGKNVKVFEEGVKEKFNVKHAVAVNSLTSGLISSVGAIGIEPGDEVIVSPLTMSATATAILWWNAIPVFADIESDTFCLSPQSIKKNLSSYTKAIIATDIFGQSADMDAINDIARANNLKVISDSAQAPNAMYNGAHAGTLADIGGYSLNYHKHIHTGEGGVLVTNDDNYAERLRLIRNHGENIVGPRGDVDLANMIGGNFRLGELEAAIGIQQLKKLDKLTNKMTGVGEKLRVGLTELEGLRPPVVREGCTHVYYTFPMVIDPRAIGTSREKILDALRAEGVPIGKGYVNIHTLPIFLEKIAYGKNGFPWSSEIYRGSVRYGVGTCPVAESLHSELLVSIPICAYDWQNEDVESVIRAFHKVWGALPL